eukprot:3796761-Alexandrium_andersonii.AAC.1
MAVCEGGVAPTVVSEPVVPVQPIALSSSADPNSVMDVMLQAQQGGAGVQALASQFEVSLALKEVVGEFKSIAGAVRENQEATLNLHKQQTEFAQQ